MRRPFHYNSLMFVHFRHRHDWVSSGFWITWLFGSNCWLSHESVAGRTAQLDEDAINK